MLVSEFVNHDLDSIVTPVRAKEFKELLLEYKYDSAKTQYLVDGFTYGFDLCYQGPINRKDSSQNIPLQIGSKHELWEKMMKEVKERWYVGPFRCIPYEYYIQSPVGLVPKDGGKKTRLIFHLSYTFEKAGNQSVNACILRELCTVHYNDTDEAIHCSFVQGGSLRQVVYGKTSAFCLVPLRSSCWWILITKVDHPIKWEIFYFVDKCLPFGAKISCKIFQDFSDAIKYLVQCKSGLLMAIVNYLDDFLFIAMTVRGCNHLMVIFMDICKIIGVPISAEKTVWSTAVLVFLGVLLNGSTFKLSIPEEKQIKAINALQRILSKQKVTVQELQQLTGLLNFLNRAIFTGRAFTRRMYAKFSGIIKIRKSGTGCAEWEPRVLKLHHHVKLDAEFKADCRVWLEFLDSRMLSTVSRPYVDMTEDKALLELEFFSDAS